jgi:hypothetical protein
VAKMISFLDGCDGLQAGFCNSIVLCLFVIIGYGTSSVFFGWDILEVVQVVKVMLIEC